MQFNKGIPTVNEHIKNIYKEKEVDRNSTIRKFRIVQAEGERQVKRKIGYRIFTFYSFKSKI